jgi:hypothetical protein
VNALEDWVAQVCAMLGIDAPDQAQTGAVLDVAREVAHGVLRPAAPLSAYLMGVAVGRGVDAVAAAAAITELVRARTPGPTSATGVAGPGDLAEHGEAERA